MNSSTALVSKGAQSKKDKKKKANFCWECERNIAICEPDLRDKYHTEKQQKAETGSVPLYKPKNLNYDMDGGVVTERDVRLHLRTTVSDGERDTPQFDSHHRLRKSFGVKAGHLTK